MHKANLAAAFAAIALLPPGAIFADAGPSEQVLNELREKLTGIQASTDAIIAAADEDGGRDFTDEELATIEENGTEAEKIGKQIKAREAALKVSGGAGRRSAPEMANRSDPANGGRRTVPATVRDSGRHNFNSMGEFAMGVRALVMGQHDNESVKKVMAAATTYGNESTGADGGFLVPPDFSREIWTKVEAEENLMSRCAELTPSGNSMSIPKDESTPWGTSGIRVYWEGEAATHTQSKGVFENSTFRLVKLTALAPVTDETLEDAQGFTSWIMAKVPGIMSHAINTGILRGNGVGKPLGVLNAPSLVSVAKETSQPADTVWMTNVNKMWARMYAPWRRNAIWVINQDVEPQLEGMSFVVPGATAAQATAGYTPVYLPPGGMADAPYGRLKGRPVVPLQAASGIGDKGDIMLIDFNQYWVLRKASGMKTDTSIHLYFDQSITAFRFVFRINGQPAWSAAITPENSSASLSWAVSLDDR